MKEKNKFGIVGIFRKVLYLIIIGIVFKLSDVYYVSITEDMELNDELESYMVEISKELPKEVALGITLDKVTKEDKSLYVTFTLNDIDSNDLSGIKLMRFETSLLSEQCNADLSKKLIKHGYSYIFIYNIFDKKDSFRVKANRDNCLSFWAKNQSAK